MYEEFTNMTDEQALSFCREKSSQPVRFKIASRIELGDVGPVLDVGCGNGIDARFYDPDLYLGLDVSPPLIRAAKAHNPKHEFEVGDITRLRFGAREWDYVICKSVLPHLPSEGYVVKAMRELFRVARKHVFVVWNATLAEKGGSVIQRVKAPDVFGGQVWQNHYDRSLIMSCAPAGANVDIESIGGVDLWDFRI